MLLRPLPVRDPSTLVNLAAPGPNPGSQSCAHAGECDDVFTYPMFLDLEKGGVFNGIAAHLEFGANLAYDGQTTDGLRRCSSRGRTSASSASSPRSAASYGRTTTGSSATASIGVLSYGFGRTKLGGDPNVVNKTIAINGQPFTIVGVAPRGFEGTTLGSRPDVFVPITMQVVMTGVNGFESRRAYWVYLFARLKPGLSDRAARMPRSTAIYITDHRGRRSAAAGGHELLRPWRSFVAKEVTITEAARGQSGLHREVSTPAALLVLDHHGRAPDRVRQHRQPASRARGRSGSGNGDPPLDGREPRHAGPATPHGIPAARRAGRSGEPFRGPLDARGDHVPAAARVRDVAARFDQRPGDRFAALVALGTGFLFGMFPALHSTRPDLVTMLERFRGQAVRRAGRRALPGHARDGADRAVDGAARVRGTLREEPDQREQGRPGAHIDHVVTFRVSPSLNGYEPAASAELFTRAEEALAAIPGVTAVSTGVVGLLTGNSWGSDVSVEGFKYAAGHGRELALQRGRTALFLDDRHAARGRSGVRRIRRPRRPEVRDHQRGVREEVRPRPRDAVGKYMAALGPDELDRQIVGVVQDASYYRVKEAVPPRVLHPGPPGRRPRERVLLRARGRDRAVVRAPDPRGRKRLDPNLPIEDLKTLPQQVTENVFLDRMISTLSAAFAVLATLLAAVGLYGVLSFTVAQRTREIGVRMALGAEADACGRWCSAQVARMMVIGGGVGIGGASRIGRFAQSLLFGLTGADPVGSRRCRCCWAPSRSARAICRRCARRASTR